MDAAVAALSIEEIQEFITNGFLVKRNILDTNLCAAARDRLWAGSTSSHLRRDDPATWINGIPEVDRLSTPDGMNDRTGDYGWRLRELSGDEDMIDLLPRRVFPWFEQLLGAGEVVTPEVSSSAADPDPRGSRLRGWPVWGGKELRGIYCVLPQERTSASPSLAEAARAGAHIDSEPMHLVVSGYIDDSSKGRGWNHPVPRQSPLALRSRAGLRRHRPLFKTAPTSSEQRRRGIRAAAASGSQGRTGPRPSPPPTVRVRYGLELGPAVAPPDPRAEGPGVWADWSEAVRTAAVG